MKNVIKYHITVHTKYRQFFVEAHGSVFLIYSKSYTLTMNFREYVERKKKTKHFDTIRYRYLIDCLLTIQNINREDDIQIINSNKNIFTITIKTCFKHLYTLHTMR